MTGVSERSPLLKGKSTSPTSSSSPLQSTPFDSSDREEASSFHQDDIVTVEGAVLYILEDLRTRGYSIPAGLVEEPSNELTPSEIEWEHNLFRHLLTIPRHQRVLSSFLPPLTSTSTPNEDTQDFHSSSNTFRTTPRQAAGIIRASGSNTIHPSPLSSEINETGTLSSPSALFLAALLSLLISLQDEIVGTAEETDRGVDAELRRFKARRELGERLYAVVLGLLDSYLLSGDEKDEEGQDALVTLLFKDFPLKYDSIDRATCSLDLILNLSSYPLVEAERIVSHAVVLASTEYVWRKGLQPSPRRGEDTSLSWWNSLARLDRFAVPRILHSQTYVLSTLHAAITVYILVFSSYNHFDSLNPLSPDAYVQLPIKGHPTIKSWSVVSALFWWLWVAGTLGWAGEVGRAWHHRGPRPSLPLSPSTLLPLIHHSLVFISLLFRFSLLFVSHSVQSILLPTSLTLLAWSLPFLAASRILPQNLPAFGAPTHQRWETIKDGRKRRDVGYRSPPKSIPESHRALRSLEANLGGLVQFSSYFIVFGVLLLWSLNGELDYPGMFYLPLLVLEKVRPTSPSPSPLQTSHAVSPIEARTSLAFTIVLGVVLAYFSGGRPSVSGKVPSQDLSKRGLEDLDEWDRFGREVAFRSRRERLAVVRYYTFLPTPKYDYAEVESPVLGAFSTPPLPSPLNIVVPLFLGISAGCNLAGREDLGKVVQERGRLWVWRIGISSLGVWAVLAKCLKVVKGNA